MLKGEYSRFLRELKGRLHFAAHSHHPWPDRSRDAQLAYWDESAKHFDGKWDHIFSDVVPEVQKAIAQILNLQNPSRIAFASNTHEFGARLLSCLEMGAKVLTTDSEFYSFERQCRRLAEDRIIEVVRVPTEPFESLETRLLAAIHETRPDLLFISHVFFNSGVVLQKLTEIRDALRKAKPSALFALDAYHGFCAVPTNLALLEKDIFYLAGGYKYAQSGEGACFMTVPDTASKLRPRNTGWFSDFENLAQLTPKAGLTDPPVTYGSGGARFRGATMDFTPLYRMRAVLPWLMEVGLDRVHEHVQTLQARLLEQLKPENIISAENWVPPGDLSRIGHFLAFEIAPDSGQSAETLVTNLEDRGIIVDRRGNRVRVGIGTYHDKSDIDRLVQTLGQFKLRKNRSMVG